MNYELIESPTNPGHWHVEAFNEDGECIKAVFSGPDAARRAEDYARFEEQKPRVEFYEIPIRWLEMLPPDFTTGKLPK